MNVSVMITTRNYTHFLEDALLSVQRQTLQPLQVVVVDDASDDDPSHVLQTYEEGLPIRYLRTATNVGQLAALTLGSRALEACDVVALLDADDMWEADHLERSVAAFRARPSPDVVMSALRFIEEAPAPENWQPLQGNQPFETEESEGLMPPDWLRTVFLRWWFGRPTSCMLFRYDVKELLLENALNLKWRIRADDVVLFRAAAHRLLRQRLGAPASTIYRVHNANSHAFREVSIHERLRRDLAVHHLLEPFRASWTLMTPYERVELFRTEIAQIFADHGSGEGSVICEWIIDAVALDHRDNSMFHAELARLRPL